MRHPVQLIMSGVIGTPLSFVHNSAVFSRRALSFVIVAILASHFSQSSPQQPISLFVLSIVASINLIFSDSKAVINMLKGCQLRSGLVDNIFLNIVGRQQLMDQKAVFFNACYALARAFDACDIGLSFALGLIIKVVQGSPVVIGGVVIGLK